MSYADEAALSMDSAFTARLAACLSHEAQLRAPDEFAAQVVRAPFTAAGQTFMPFISTAPGFGDAYQTGGQDAIDDGMLLSSVQASWDAVAAAQSPA